MKSSAILLAIVLLAFFSSCNRESAETKNTVNAVIGDISFKETFGHEPTGETNEILRLQTHLKYVEKLLRNRDISHLTKTQQEKRSEILDLLHDYWKAGMFPKNYDVPGQRVPCFIDKDVNICAVGYLIEQTAGREVAEEINSKYKYEYLLAMNDPTVDN